MTYATPNPTPSERSPAPAKMVPVEGPSWARLQTMTAMANNSEKRRGRVGFWIGGLLVLAGIAVGVAGVALGIRGIGETVDGYQRVPVRTGGTVQIDDPGSYRVFFERAGADDGFGSPGGFSIVGPDGQEVLLESDFSSENYSVGGHTGRKIGKFRAATAGRYEIRPLSVDGGTGTGTIAIGKRGPTGSILAIVVGVLGGLLIVVIGVVVLIVSGVRRSRSRRAATGYPGGPGPGWGAPPTGPGGWAPPPGGAPGWAAPHAPAPPPAPGGWPPPPPTNRGPQS